MNKKKIGDKDELDLGDMEPKDPHPAIPHLDPKRTGAGEHKMGEEALIGEKADYELGQWNGIEQFKCARCSFDTLIKNEMIEHLFWVHSIIIEE
jgi:hypothetical protein